MEQQELPQDGVHFNDRYNEYEIVIDGEAVAWSSTEEQGWRSYLEMLGIRADHVRRNRANKEFIRMEVN